MGRIGDNPTGWDVISTQTTPDGDVFNVWEGDDGQQIALPDKMIPDDKTLRLFAMNGVEPSPGDGASVNTETSDDDPTEISVGRVLAALALRDESKGTRAEIRVNRIKADGSEAYCTKFTPEEFEQHDLDLIRRVYGSGRYRIKVMQSTATHDEQGNKIKHGGKFVVRTNQVVEIDAPLMNQETDSKGSGDPAMMEFLRMMQNQNAQIVEALSKKPDANQDFRTMLGNMKLMRDALGLDGATSEQKGGVSQLIKDMEALDDFKKRFGGEKGNEDENNILSVGSKLIETIANAQRGSQNQPLPQVQLPTSVQQPAQPLQPAVEISEEDEMNVAERMMVNAKLRFLCKLAEKDSPIEQQAEELAAELPDAIVEALAKDDWFDVISADNEFPIIKPYREWFTKLRDEVIRLLKEDGYFESPENPENA